MPNLASKPVITLSTLAALAMTPVLASCSAAEAQTGERAAPAEEQTRQCFFPRQVNGFRSVEDENGRRVEDRVLIDVGAADTYEFQLMRRCPGLRFARNIALETAGQGRVCTGLDVDLIINDTLGPERCRVVGLRKLPADDPNARAGARD
mgnify:CR=1 FL=1